MPLQSTHGRLVCILGMMYLLTITQVISGDSSSTSEASSEDILRDCDSMCASGTRCVIRAGMPTCKATHKQGRCPPPVAAETGCFITCDDDADCGPNYKCCGKRCGGRGCKKLIL